MFTPQEALSLPPEAMVVVFEDFKTLSKLLQEAYKELWSKGIRFLQPKTDENSLKYEIREWQQLSAEMKIFYEKGIGFLYYSTHPIRNEDGSYSYLTENWAYYGMAKALIAIVPSSYHPTLYNFNDKAAASSFRFATKQGHLIDSYVANGEVDVEHNGNTSGAKPSTATPKQSKSLLAPEPEQYDPQAHKAAMVASLLKKGLYPSAEAIYSKVETLTEFTPERLKTKDGVTKLWKKLEELAKAGKG